MNHIFLIIILIIMNNILVTGANGQLGFEIEKEYEKKYINYWWCWFYRVTFSSFIGK